MSGDLKIRTVRTGSGATAVQLIRYVNRKRIIVRHVGSAHSEAELSMLYSKAEQVRDTLCQQTSLFSDDAPSTRLQLHAVTHRFAYEALLDCSRQCGLGQLHPLYQDLALMRLIEPTSKLRTLELLARYFKVTYARRTMYRLLPMLLTQKAAIEKAAYQTAVTHFKETFVLVLYDVTTLYFESHQPDDDLLAKGFSKDDKSKQPQIVIGLLVTIQGFPLLHDVYKGNTFEGHTMLAMVNAFQQHHPQARPIIVGDAAMLSHRNLQLLEAQGYQYIVGARLANTTPSFLELVSDQLLRQEGATLRLPYPNRSYDVICSYSEVRYRKDKRTFEKQREKAEKLIKRKEPGKRAKFVKKSGNTTIPYVFDEVLKEKTEKLLGVKGYCTNIPEDQLLDKDIIAYYHELWHVEQTFRMSKSDLKTRPIFHYAHEAIKAHVLLCFMSLMMGKFLEIKTGLSIRRIKDILWSVHEAQIEDALTGERITLRTNLTEYCESELANVLKPH